jgi:DNA-binding transcriptional regulator GbsR (MarR family)
VAENKEVKGSRKDAFEADNNQWLTSCHAKKGPKQKGRKRRKPKILNTTKSKKNRNQKLNSYSNQNIKDTKEEILLNRMKDIQHTY